MYSKGSTVIPRVPLAAHLWRQSVRTSAAATSPTEAKPPPVRQVVTQAKCTHVTEKGFNEIPGPKGAALWPLVGPAFLFKPFTDVSMSRPDMMAIDLHRKYGNIVRVRLPMGYAVLLKDPQDMLTLLENEGRSPVRPGFGLVMAYFKAKNIKTLATMNGEEWRHLRMRVQPSFLRPAAADPYVSVIGRVADDLVAYFEQNRDKDQDARDIVLLYVIECLYQFCFNRRLGALTTGPVTHNETVRMIKLLITTLCSPSLLPFYKIWRTKAYKNIELSMDHLLEISSKEVKRTIQALNNKEVKDPNSPHFIENLLATTDLSEQEVVTSMGDFFFGGTDTTSKNLSMILFHLSKYPEQQQILYEEIRTVVGNGPVTKEHLTQMEFLKACVKESMRVTFPLAPGPARVLPHDLTLSGYKVPKGTLVMLSNTAYIKDSNFVNCPEEFQPQRWLRGKDRQKRETIPTVCYLPFGVGARMCIGKRFAEQIMYLGLIKLVQNYELRLKDDPRDIHVTYEIFPTIDRSLRINFTPRPKT